MADKVNVRQVDSAGRISIIITVGGNSVAVVAESSGLIEPLRLVNAIKSLAAMMEAERV